MPRLPLLLAVCALACIAAAPASRPAYVDPVPHYAITQPYRVCQDLEELTARIGNLYRKPFGKLYDNGVAQAETVIFKDVATGHEIAGLTRELCVDIAHPDLKRPVWTADGARLMFMGNRGFFMPDGALKAHGWTGWKFVMEADYTRQRPLVVTFLDAAGKAVRREVNIEGKFNVYDRKDARYVYYAVKETLWRLRLGAGLDDSVAEPICTFATPHAKIIQDISDDNVLLIQDTNGEFVPAAQRAAYAPEFHLVHLSKDPKAAGFYDHHPFDYGLPEVKDAAGKVLHAAGNNKNLHSLAFADRGTAINWNYGSMVDVGEYLGWTLDISGGGLQGTPTHGPVGTGSQVNRWGQYESHGGPIGGGSTCRTYFSGPAKVGPKDTRGQWGLWLSDSAKPEEPPIFLLRAAGGHEANSRCQDPTFWGAFIQRTPKTWKPPIPEHDGIVCGDTAGKWGVVCYTHSDVRGGIKRDRATGKVAWSGMDNNDFRPYHAIPRPLLSPDGTKVFFHSCMLQPLEEWTGMYVAVARRPMPPANLRAAAEGGATRLTWDTARMANETRGYHVYRGDPDGKNVVELTDAPVRERGWADTTAVAGKAYAYAVTAEEWSGIESERTSNVAGPGVNAPAEGWAKWDVTPPPAVEGFTVAKEADEDGQYRLAWAASGAKDVRHYNIYFSSAGRPAVSQKRLIVSPVRGTTRYLDWSAPHGTTAYYAITAVDRQGNESAPAFAQWTRDQ